MQLLEKYTFCLVFLQKYSSLLLGMRWYRKKISCRKIIGNTGDQSFDGLSGQSFQSSFHLSKPLKLLWNPIGDPLHVGLHPITRQGGQSLLSNNPARKRGKKGMYEWQCWYLAEIPFAKQKKSHSPQRCICLWLLDWSHSPAAFINDQHSMVVSYTVPVCTVLLCNTCARVLYDRS